MSNWYAVQCVSGKEGIVREKLQGLYAHYQTFFPRRELEIRRSGKTHMEIKALFPGYIFIQSSSRLIYREALDIARKINETFSSAALLKVVGMYRGAKSIGSDEILPIQNHEISLFLEIASENEIVQFSQYKKVGDKIQIIGGPLAGLEAIILKINARKKRVRVGVELMGQTQMIDLGAEMIS
ncbi:MAG: antiterminator LoaP [Spirochaetia bacterium]|nr:antiterminator LoaP [Spirochaetia bacterium]